MEPYTKQSAFDKAAVHLLKQGSKALRGDDNDLCAYRSEDGKMCGVGILVPDDVYNVDMEGRSASFISEITNLFDCPISQSMPFLDEIQRIHDSEKPFSWKAELIEMAGEYHLSTKAIDNL